MFKVGGSRIRMTRGDTGLLTIITEGAELTAQDRVVFTIRKRSGGLIVEKVGIPEENRVQFPLMNEETQNLREGDYEWDIRVVLDAQMDAQGRVTDGREVITPMKPGTLTIERAVGKV